MSDNSNGESARSRPRTRQRMYKPPPPLEVPDIEDDAAERKRVLNVLAQRRYRQKKRQRRLKGDQGSNDGASPEAEDEHSASFEEGSLDAVGPVDAALSHSFDSSLLSPNAIFGVDLGYCNWDVMDDPISTVPDVGLYSGFLTESQDGSKGTYTISTPPGTVPPSTMISHVMFGSPPSLDSASSSSSPDVSFPDSYLLPVHELTVLRAMLRIADRLGCRGQLWSLDALSPFNQGIATPSDQLPSPWRPTPSQVLIPHHPIVDFLPWPNTRDKILGILSLPDDARPPTASGPLALVNFAYDFEDNAEGVRIYGSDPYDPNSWEVGQVLFQRWWFLFDREIIDNSNRWRRLRGAPPLTMVSAGTETGST